MRGLRDDVRAFHHFGLAGRSIRSVKDHSSALRRLARRPFGAADRARRVRPAARRAVWQETLVRSLEALGHKTQSARQALPERRRGWLAGSVTGGGPAGLTPETAGSCPPVPSASTRSARTGAGTDTGCWSCCRVPENRRDLRDPHAHALRVGGVRVSRRGPVDRAACRPRERDPRAAGGGRRDRVAHVARTRSPASVTPRQRRVGRVGPRRRRPEYDSFVREFAGCGRRRPRRSSARRRCSCTRGASFPSWTRPAGRTAAGEVAACACAGGLPGTS